LIALPVAEKNQLGRAAPAIADDIHAHLAYLQQRLSALEQPIETLLTQQADWQRKPAIWLSVNGIGAITAAQCLAEWPELGALSDQQIARWVGLAPMNADTLPQAGTHAERPTPGRPFVLLIGVAAKTCPNLLTFNTIATHNFANDSWPGIPIKNRIL